MERLNDIMMRTAQRRQHMHNPQALAQGQDTSMSDTPSPGMPSQGQSSRPPFSRRPPLPEQNARQGQYSSQPQQRQQTQPPRSVQSSQPSDRQMVQGTTQRSEPPARYSQQRPYNQGQRKGSNERRPMYYHQPTSQKLPAPQSDYAQRQQQVSGDYYDSYEAIPPADVQEEWEEDASAMRYGDWEGDDGLEDTEVREHRGGNYSSDIPRATQPPIEPNYAPSQGATWATTRDFSHTLSSPLATRQLSTLSSRELENRSPLTRRDPRLSPSVQSTHQSQQLSPTVPPAPLAPTQESQRYHRHTQPLNPQAVVNMNPRGAQEPSSSSGQAIQRYTRNMNTSVQPGPGPCRLCKGAGYLRADVPYGHPNFGKPIACECKEVERAEKRRMHLRTISNLDAFRDKSFKNFNSHVPGILDSFNLCQQYANDPDGWLLLIGRNGCGKTHLAAAIANQHLTKGSLVLFATVPDLLDHLRATFAPTSTTVYDQLFSSMREAELLVLDDLGSEQNSPWASEKLFQLLNYRYNSRFPTVITTNNLRLQSVDDRIRSRLMDKSLVTEVLMDRVHDYRPHNPRRE